MNLIFDASRVEGPRPDRVEAWAPRGAYLVDGAAGFIETAAVRSFDVQDVQTVIVGAPLEILTVEQLKAVAFSIGCKTSAKSKSGLLRAVKKHLEADR